MLVRFDLDVRQLGDIGGTNFARGRIIERAVVGQNANQRFGVLIIAIFTAFGHDIAVKCSAGDRKAANRIKVDRTVKFAAGNGYLAAGIADSLPRVLILFLAFRGFKLNFVVISTTVDDYAAAISGNINDIGLVTAECGAAAIDVQRFNVAAGDGQ